MPGNYVGTYQSQLIKLFLLVLSSLEKSYAG